MDDNAVVGYALKADIRHYFESINHGILLGMISKKIKDAKIMWLIETILESHKTEVPGNGMPLGNLTSQFFANLYLDGFDHFVKEGLRAKHYIRYVDDFVILHLDRETLSAWQERIDGYLKEELRLQLHPEKSRIIPLRRGLTIIGFRLFYRYRLLKKSNARRIWKRLEKFGRMYHDGGISRKEAVRSLEGWLAYASFADTYNLRRKVVARFNEIFGSQDRAL